MINAYYTLSIILYVALVLTSILNQESEVKNDPSRKNQVLIPQQQRIVCNTFYARCDRNGIKEDNSSNDRTLCCENTDAKRNTSLGSYNDASNSNGNEEDGDSDEVSLIPVKNVEDTNRKKKKKVHFDIPEKKNVVSNIPTEFLDVYNHFIVGILRLKGIDLILEKEYIYQITSQDQNLRHNCSVFIDKDAIVSGLVEIYRHMLEHNGKQNARTREIVKKIVNHMKHSFLLFLCLDDSIHIISEMYDDIFVELKIDRERDTSRIHNILAKYTRHRRGFRYLNQTLELLDMLINMASNKLLNRLLILLNALSEQYNTEPEKIRQSVNGTVEHMLHIYHEICHALNDNFDEVLEKSRDFSILLTSNKTKKSVKKIFQYLMLCKARKSVKIESSPEAKYDDNLQETLELLKSNLFSVQLTSNSVRDCLLVRSAFQLIFKMLFICEAYLESFDVLNSGNGMRVSQ